MKKIKLIAPNGLPIKGVKLINGDIGEIDCFYYRNKNHQDWIIPKNILKQEDCYIFIDSSDNEWALTPDDVFLTSL